MAHAGSRCFLLVAVIIMTAFWSTETTYAAPIPSPNRTAAATDVSSTQQAIDHERDQRRDKDESLDKRIDDVNARVSDIVIALTVLGTIITLIIAFGTVVAYFSAAQRARDAARAWMDEHADNLQTSLVKIEARASEAERLAGEADSRAKEADRINIAARDTFAEAKSKSEGFMQEIEAAKRRVQAALSASASTPVLAPEEGGPKKAKEDLTEARGVLSKADQLAREKPESTYSVDDWENRAYAAVAEHDLEAAATFFRNVGQAKNASPLQIARAAVNRGAVLGQLGRSAEELATYDEVVSRYVADGDPAVREQAAMAMRYKGLTQSELGNLEEAVKTFDAVEEHYSSDAAPGVRKEVLATLLNKGNALGKLQHFEEAAATFGRLTQFETSTEPSVLRVVAAGMANAISVLARAQQYDRALQFFDTTITFMTTKASGYPWLSITALNNKAETLDRMGREADALAVLDQTIHDHCESHVPQMQNRLVESTFMKALTLGRLERVDEARTIFREIVVKHDASANKGVLTLVEKSRAYADAPVTEWDYVDVTWFDSFG